jgi:hypothetical protein
MTCTTLGGCTICFHLCMAGLAETMADILPGAKFFVSKISIMASITLGDRI